MQKKYLMFHLCWVILFAIATNGCTFNNEEEYFGITECDTIDITYTDLTYIFTNVCATCHNVSYPAPNGILMVTYNDVVTSVNSGLVLPAIKQTGSIKMPQGQDKLSDCDISKIEAWINAGMPEN